MIIYLIRHGDAEEHKIGRADSERKLTDEGKKKMHRAAEAWKNLIGGFDYLVSSPLIRAKETAEIAKEVFEFKDDILIDSRLAFGNNTDDIIALANELGGNVAMFGHEPDFSAHVSNLISYGGALIDFKKGMIAKISFNGKAKLGAGTLEFLIPTKAFK